MLLLKQKTRKMKELQKNREKKKREPKLRKKNLKSGLQKLLKCIMVQLEEI